MTPARLYPQIEPYSRFRLDVGDGHELYCEICGNPEGKTAVVLHGGPGAGCSPFMRRFLDPRVFRIVLYDQRGAGRSTPSGGLEHNTSLDLVRDMEKLRAHVGADEWLVFGGSWGSTLALLYAQRHPERVTELVLRGIFTMTAGEIDWFYGGGAARFFPEAWTDFIAPIPAGERGDLIAAYYRRLIDPDETVQTRFARAWVRWESATASLRPVRANLPVNAAHARAFARIECHFFQHRGWLDRDDRIMADMGRIAHIPGVIAQGRYDVICPPQTALRVAEAWPAAEFVMVDDAGHALSEPGIASALIAATDRFRADQKV